MNIGLQTYAVTKTYAAGSSVIKAVDEVSLTVRSGEFIALVGPSGSGKTTLLAMLAGLLAPTEGGIQIDGQDMHSMRDGDLTAFRRSRIGFTFQSNNLVPFLTAQENVELMLRLNGRLDRAGKARAKQMLERLGLADRLGNLPRQLSGGEQQRVAIARALIHEPSVVLADEPTASLDSERAFQVVETFAGIIREQNRAGIMVTHDLRMVQHVDRVVQMMDGRIDRVIEDRNEILAMAGGGTQLAPILPLFREETAEFLAELPLAAD